MLSVLVSTLFDVHQTAPCNLHLFGKVGVRLPLSAYADIRFINIYESDQKK